MFVVPVDEFRTPALCVVPEPALPPVIVAEVIVRVPVPELFTAGELMVPQDFISEDTIEALAGDAAEKVTQIDPDPVNMLAVRVTPLLKVNDPPFVAPPVVSLRTSATVALTLTVIAKLFAINTSEDVNDGNKSLAVPVGVVAQTSAALMFPALRAK
jgi:hypothetical protein